MMASPSELSLECKPHSYSMLLKSVGDQQPSDQTQKLEEFLARLEEERLKIDAFKRELPLCMQLLTNAMEASRQQLQSYRVVKPVLEEFIPLKHIPIMCEEGSDNNNKNKKTIITTNNNNPSSDKANWMTSAQLWSDHQDVQHEEDEEEETKKHPRLILSSSSLSPNNNNNKLEASGLLGFGVNLKQQRNGGTHTHTTGGGGGGAFLPFNSKERNTSSKLVLPELALASSSPPDHHHHHHHQEKETEENKKNLESSCRMMDQQVKGPVAGDSQTNATTNNNNSNNTTTTNQTHRKARRCWSPDLHRRFVNALQMLGGSQVATPKQIRELMKVDGLTNDEVKSHLQKYRLHTRRPSPSPQAAAAAAPQLVVLGGIWVPSEYATAAAAAHHGGAPPTLYGAHHASSPHHYCATPVPQEFYPTTAPPPPLPPTQATAAHHHHHHHQLHHHSLHNQLHHHVYHPASQTTVHSSPESDIRGGNAAGDRSESIEDGKSESSSWKADDSNGENGGERKILALRGEDGEESNGSEITLKF